MGHGIYVGSGGQGVADLLRADGPFVNGFVVMNPLSGSGLTFAGAVGGGYGPLVQSGDTQSANTRLMAWLNGAGALRSIDYNRGGEWLSMPGGQYLSTTSAQVGLGAFPVAGVLAYLNNTVAGQTGLQIANTAAAGNAPAAAGTARAGKARAASQAG